MTHHVIPPPPTSGHPRVTLIEEYRDGATPARVIAENYPGHVQVGDTVERAMQITAWNDDQVVRRIVDRYEVVKIEGLTAQCRRL